SLSAASTATPQCRRTPCDGFGRLPTATTKPARRRTAARRRARMPWRRSRSHGGGDYPAHGMTHLHAYNLQEPGQFHQFRQGIWRQLVQPLPHTLWYYTNASTFAHILKSKQIWSTQISCLNDHSEFRFSVRLLRDELKLYMGNADEHIRYLARHLWE